MLNEIRKQSDRVRALFMWLSVFIVFSAVVFVWVNSFEQRLSFMLEGGEEKALVQAGSPFAVIGSSAGDLKAAVLGLFGLASDEGGGDADDLRQKTEQRIKPRLLPVSE